MCVEKNERVKISILSIVQEFVLMIVFDFVNVDIMMAEINVDYLMWYSCSLVNDLRWVGVRLCVLCRVSACGKAAVAGLPRAECAESACVRQRLEGFYMSRDRTLSPINHGGRTGQFLPRIHRRAPIQLPQLC